MAIVEQKVFDEIRKAGGCIYGGGTKGQGSHLCRAAVAPGEKYCPRHLMLLDTKQDKPATRRRS